MCTLYNYEIQYLFLHHLDRKVPRLPKSKNLLIPNKVGSREVGISGALNYSTLNKMDPLIICMGPAGAVRSGLGCRRGWFCFLWAKKTRISKYIFIYITSHNMYLSVIKIHYLRTELPSLAICRTRIRRWEDPHLNNLRNFTCSTFKINNNIFPVRPIEFQIKLHLSNF